MEEIREILKHPFDVDMPQMDRDMAAHKAAMHALPGVFKTIESRANQKRGVWQ